MAIRLTGNEPLAPRASRRLKNDELLVTSLAATRLRLELDRVPLWRGNHVAIKQLVEDFGRYLYLPRLQDPGVLLRAIQSGLSLLTWEQDSFAYAESFDEAGNRYRGLQSGQQMQINADDPGLLVKPEIACLQLDQETSKTGTAGTAGGTISVRDPGATPTPDTIAPPGQIQPPKPRRYHGTVVLDSQRVGRDAGRIADEVITHLVGLVGSSVRVTLEIEADIPQGAPDHVVRTVTENSRTLKFSSSGFETE